MIVAVTARFEEVPGEKPFDRRYYLPETLKSVFDDFDVLPLVLVSEESMEEALALASGLIVPGSFTDISPHIYGEEALADTRCGFDEFSLDKKAIELFAARGKPVLGICGGMQSINVCFGGSLHQHIEGHFLRDVRHKIRIADGSFLSRIYGERELAVNSYHHQSVKDTAAGFDICAYGGDGTVEAIARDNIVGVQWHPELEKDTAFFRYFFRELCRRGL